MDDWDWLGNVTAQWWVLMNVATLFARLGEDRPATLLAGAVLGTGEGPDLHAPPVTTPGCRDAVRQVSARLGEDIARATLSKDTSRPSTRPWPWPGRPSAQQATQRAPDYPPLSSFG